MTNMKILVFSDSHGRLGAMMDAMERERPRRVFFLGDCYRDGEALRDAYPDVPMELVRGNCDWDQAPDELMVETGASRRGYLRVNGEEMPAELVRERLLKLDGEHIRYVMDSLRQNTAQVVNIRAYTCHRQ